MLERTGSEAVRICLASKSCRMVGVRGTTLRWDKHEAEDSGQGTALGKRHRSPLQVAGALKADVLESWMVIRHITPSRVSCAWWSSYKELDPLIDFFGGRFAIARDLIWI